MDADILLAARRNPTQRPHGLGHPPADDAAAYRIQAEVMAALGDIGGWKVGHNPADGSFTCAPIPATAIHPTPAHLTQAECPDRMVEAEIAVLLAHGLPPREQAYTEADVAAAIGSAHPAIEVLQSRYADVDAVDKPTNLADSLSNHALVCGPAIDSWQAIDLAAETVRVVVNGQELKRATGNPAGPMLPLLVWLANVGTRWAGGLKAGQMVTTGSWTGKDRVPAGAFVAMVFDQCGTVEAKYT